MNNISLVRNEDGTDFTSHIVSSSTDLSCFIGKNGGDNADAKFIFEAKGGQVKEGSRIEMCGPWERAGLLPFLKQMVYEMELIEKNEK